MYPDQTAPSRFIVFAYLLVLMLYIPVNNFSVMLYNFLSSKVELLLHSKQYERRSVRSSLIRAHSVFFQGISILQHLNVYSRCNKQTTFSGQKIFAGYG